MGTPPMRPYRTSVYFARCGRYVKIGFADDPARRIRHLFDGKLICPEDIDCAQRVELLHTIPDCRIRDERLIHSLFAAHHVAGEWFRFDLAFVRHLAGFQYVTDRARLRQAFLFRRELKKSRLRGDLPQTA